MADRYWVGGNASWDATAGTKWATTSGGAGGAAVPTAADDVYLDNGTGTGNVTIAANVVCRKLDCTGYTGTLTYDTNARTLTIGTSSAGASNIALNFVAGMTYTILGIGNTINFVSTSTTEQSVTTAGKTMPSMGFNGAGGKWALQDNVTATGATITVTTGTFITNNVSITCGHFSFNSGSAKTLTLGSSAFTCTGATGWSGRGTSTTMTANTATVTCTGSDQVINLSLTTGVNYNGTSFISTGAGSVSAVVSSSGTTTIANLTRTGTAVKADSFSLTAGVTLVITGTLTLGGNTTQGVNRLHVLSSSHGSTHTLSMTGGAVVINGDVDFKDITINGSPSWTNTDSAYIGDGLGNSSLITTNRTTPATQTWSGTSGGNWSTNAWSGRAPLPQDDVVISSSFSGGQTITVDMPRAGRDIDFTGVSGSPTLNSSIAYALFGSITLATGLGTVSGSNNSINLLGRGSHTLTWAGKNLSIGSGSANFTINAPGGTYTLADAFSMTGSSASNGFFVTQGTFDTADNNMIIRNFGSAGALTRSVILGTSTITVQGSSNFWSVSGSNVSISAADSTIILGTTSSVTRTFAGAGFTYGTLTFTVSGSVGGLTITGSNTFSNINFSDATNARTLAFTAATTTTITGNFNVVGTSGKLMTIQSVTAATHTLSKASGTVACDYLSVTNSIATGGASWYAGANSIDGGGNTGWIFLEATTTSTSTTTSLSTSSSTSTSISTSSTSSSTSISISSSTSSSFSTSSSISTSSTSTSISSSTSSSISTSSTSSSTSTSFSSSTSSTSTSFSTSTSTSTSFSTSSTSSSTSSTSSSTSTSTTLPPDIRTKPNVLIRSDYSRIYTRSDYVGTFVRKRR